MAKKKKEPELSEPVAEFADMDPMDPMDPPQYEEPVPARKKSSTKRTKAKPAKRMNFDRYARSKGFRTTHIPGMKAFAKNPNMLRTLEAWDAFFKDY